MFICLSFVYENGNITLPNIKGFTAEFANIHRGGNLFFGTCDDDADTNKDGVVRVLSQAEYDNEKVLETIAARKYRDDLLKSNVDTINAVRWESMTEEEKNSMKIYRQALLDITEQPNFPFGTVWPEYPLQ